MSDNPFGYDKRLPEDIRDIFMWLCQDVASLQFKWDLYKGLFGSKETTQLLSEVAPVSFYFIEQSLRNDITMAICRLSDPPQTRKSANLSFRILKQKCGGIEGISALIDDFCKSCSPLQVYRNKRVGHNDLNSRLEPRDFPLPGIGKEQIDRAVQLADQILNNVLQHFIDRELYFSFPLALDIDKFISRLMLAKEYETLQRKSSYQNFRGELNLPDL